jgi:hypothetical protein
MNTPKWAEWIGDRIVYPLFVLLAIPLLLLGLYGMLKGLGWL